jgi:hypothetical protein
MYDRPDLLCRAFTDTGLVYRVKAKIFSICYMCDTYTSQSKASSQEKPPISRQTGCYIRTMIAKDSVEKDLVLSLKGLGTKKKLRVNRQS